MEQPAGRTVLSFDIGIRHMGCCRLSRETGGDYRVDALSVDDILADTRYNAKTVQPTILLERLAVYLQKEFGKVERWPLVAILLELQSGHSERMLIVCYAMWMWFRKHYDQCDVDCPSIKVQSARAKLLIQIHPLPEQERLFELIEKAHFDRIAERERRREARATKKTPAKKTRKTNPKITPPRKRARSKTERYEGNKEQAILQCLLFLHRYSANRHLVAYYQSLSKQDDVADALLQALYYLEVGKSSVARKSQTIAVGKPSTCTLEPDSDDSQEESVYLEEEDSLEGSLSEEDSE